MSIDPSARIHESAYVDEPCAIGAGTNIWHFTHVRSGAVIGEGCNIGQGVYIGQDVHVGNRCKIQNNVSVYEAVTLEDEVFCGPAMVFTNVINPRAAIERKNEFRPTLIRRGATLGANCTILCGITIGRHAFIAAGAVILRDVPDYALMTGVPAKRTGWMCRCGVRLREEDGHWTCPACACRYETVAGQDAIAPS
ncbi:acetyltransferase [bacterium]|nr:acetyltransferase [bacterium]